MSTFRQEVYHVVVVSINHAAHFQTVTWKEKVLNAIHDFEFSHELWKCSSCFCAGIRGHFITANLPLKVFTGATSLAGWSSNTHGFFRFFFSFIPSLFLSQPSRLPPHLGSLYAPSSSIPQSSTALHTSTSTPFHPSIRPSTSPSRSSAWRASHPAQANWL